MFISVTLFSENMPPWKAPYVSDGKGASSGEVVEGSSGKAGECKSGNVIENVSKQSQAKGRELQKPKKTLPKKTLPKKIPKAKPTIDGPVFSQSPISMKKIKLRGKKVNPSNFMSEGEEDEGVERGGEIGERGQRPDYLSKLDAIMEPSENVVVEKENPWLGESPVKLIVE